MQLQHLTLYSPETVRDTFPEGHKPALRTLIRKARELGCCCKLGRGIGFTEAQIRAFFVSQKGTTMNFKTISVALSLALAFQPVTSFAAGTSSTALSAAAKNRLAQKLKSLAARNLPTTGVDPGTGSAAATYSAPTPADTGNSVVIESGVVVSGGLY